MSDSCRQEEENESLESIQEACRAVGVNPNILDTYRDEYLRVNFGRLARIDKEGSLQARSAGGIE